MFSISEAFDLLFDKEEEPLPRLTYEDRRWFLRPRPYSQSPDEVRKARKAARRAEHRLFEMVDGSTDIWLDRLRTQLGGALDLVGGADAGQRPNFDYTTEARRLLPPRMPYDVFAISGYLIEQAGIYHHLQPRKSAFRNLRCPLPPPDHGHDSLRHIDISHDDRELVLKAAAAWRGLSIEKVFQGSADDLAAYMLEADTWRDLEPLFESWAIVFGAYRHAPVFRRLSAHSSVADPAPGWWKHAWRLFAIADEASHDTAYNIDVDSFGRRLRGEDRSRPWFETEFFVEEMIDFDRRVEQGEVGSRQLFFAFSSLSVARSQVVSVLPKVRTPSVGCTLRSLSHHLALTPGHGVARGRWIPDFEKPPSAGETMPDGQMNLLIIPYPYAISADAFCASYVEETPPPDEGKEPDPPRFGYFDLHQRWMAEAGWRAPEGWQAPPGKDQTADWYDYFVGFVRAVLASARRHSPIIHGLVFPEMALDFEAYRRLRDYLNTYESSVELLIAGVSGKAYAPPNSGLEPADSPEAGLPQPPKRGNFVAVAAFDRGENPEALRESIREKHHRWKLERNQLREYGLLGVLSPEIQWWENIQLQSRRLDFGVIRKRSVVAALICEDLARVDPCQQLIRSVAPNLTVALLMDAPQRAGRWPARYATVLAEDPGTAVLTVTSRALMARQDRLGLYPASASDRIVAMWRDDKSEKPIELNCPYDAQGLILSVVEERAEDITLDGRLDASAMAFRYAGYVPVRLTDAKVKGDYEPFLRELDLVS